MATGSYQQPRTIRDVVKDIESSTWILPNIQRKFVWDKDRICTLYDSIMQGYPIGTCMVWKVSNETARKHKFFTFLRDYQQKWKETCEEMVLSGISDYFAVIDGQQRLNSIYLGLLGSYAEKLPRKWWGTAYDESIQPKEMLYLNLVDRTDDNQYDFVFMSDSKYKDADDKWKWFKVGKILDFSYISKDDVDDDFDAELTRQKVLDDIPQEKQNIAAKNLKRLYRKIFHEQIINYYQEEIQDLDKVVEIFVRTNSGGVPLSFSDLVMAVTIAQWPESRDKIDNLVKYIFSQNKLSIDRDFVLKVCLVLHSQDIKFRVKNFEQSGLIEKIKQNFDKIAKAIQKTCSYANRIGLNDDTLRSKYALIPLIYYTYYKNYEIDNLAKEKDNKRKMEIWIKLALLKGLFGGQPDAILPKIRSVIDDNINGDFPTKEIIDAFANSNRDISIDLEYVKGKIATAEYGSPDAYMLLSLAITVDPQLIYNVDHMYPKTMFEKKKLKQQAFLNSDPDLLTFYEEKENWNTVGNLQLLNDSENKSKNGRPLDIWLQQNPMYNKDSYFIPKDTNGDYILQFEKFKEFVEKRRDLLAAQIMQTCKL